MRGEPHPFGSDRQTATHTFTYDNNGNRETRITSAGTETYTWDDENRLTVLDTPGGDYTYVYDHRTRRIVRDESAASGALTELTFSGGTSVQEANASGTVQVELIRGSDWGGGVGGVLFTIRGPSRSYNAYNSRGDVISVTNDSGTATWQAAYEAFGIRTEEDGSNTERQRANTKDEDPTGLLNEGFRYRDLEAGVFISRDPLGFVDGPNVYTYVRQNPWSSFDPTGLSERSLGQQIKDSIVATIVISLGKFAVDVKRDVDIAKDFGNGFNNRNVAETEEIPFVEYDSAPGSAIRAGQVLNDALTFGTFGRGKPGTAGPGFRSTPPGLVPAGGAPMPSIPATASKPFVPTGAIFQTNGESNSGTSSSRSNNEKADIEVSKAAKGGAYKDVPANGGEVHHMPADSVSPLPKGKGPGARMETADHQQTASWGSSKEAKAYRQQQKELIEQGKFEEAQQMDIDDVRSKFGNKYDEGIEQMKKYTETLNYGE